MAYQEAWSAERQGPNGQWTDSNWDLLTFRVLLQGSQMRVGGSPVRLVLKGRKSGAYTVERVSLVRRDGQTLNGVAATYQPVTFNGAPWDAGVSGPAGGSVVSDAIPFELVAGQDVFVTFWCPAGSPPVARTGGATTSMWMVSSDQSATNDWEGLTISATRTYTYGVDRLEVETGVVVPPIDPPVPPVPGTPVGQWVQTSEALGQTVLENWPDPTKPETKWTVTLERFTTGTKPGLNLSIHQGEGH